MFQFYRKNWNITNIISDEDYCVWKELKKCYYLSRTFKSFKSWDVICPMLEAAATQGVSVFLLYDNEVRQNKLGDQGPHYYIQL